METTNQKMKMRLLKLVGVALFTALAYVAMLLIHFKVDYLTFDPKDALITLCGLCFGPLSALISSVIVPLLELPTSSTGFYGFIMNFLGTATLSVTVSLIYKYKKNFLGAIIGLVSGVFTMVAVMMVANLIITPLHFTGSISAEGVAAVWEKVPVLLLPFNLAKGIFNASIVLFLYKPLSTILQKIGFLPKSNAAFKFDRRTVLVSVAAAVLIAGSLVVVFFVMHGSFRFGV